MAFREPFKCYICKVIPNAHSFKLIYIDEDGTHVYYTKPSDAVLYSNTRGILTHYEDTLNDKPPNENWIWIFDAEDIQLKHLAEISTARGIIELIETHKSTLNKIIIKNNSSIMNFFIWGISYLISSEIRDKIEYE
jgi:hypothetical protein